jgi:1-acyl-sn-glycerol-3-phosphate acyltransferase
VFYGVLRFFLNIVYFGFFRLTVVGQENIPAKGAAIIAGNHVSLLDPPTLGVACAKRAVCFMAKSELFANPLFAFAIKRLGAFPLKRGKSDHAAIKAALAILSEERILGMFPEGTRSRDGVLGKAGPGVAALAGRAGVPIIPAAVLGTEKVGWRKPFPKLKVAFGRPIIFSDSSADKVVLRQRTDRLMEEIRSLLASNSNSESKKD